MKRDLVVSSALVLLLLAASATTLEACTENISPPADSADDGDDASFRSDGGDAGASTPDASSADAPTEAGPDARSAYDGQPIAAETGKWTWVPFPDTSCLNGDPAGIGINPGTSDTLFFYLEGGGACWSDETCYGAQPTTSRVNEGLEAKDIAALSDAYRNWPFNKAKADNPFKDASMVYAPYCTGDVHAGARETTYGARQAKHFGRKNIEAFLQRVVPTFPNVKRVVFAGTSAGGFGAYLNYDRVQNAFGGIRVDLVDDSGHPLPRANVTHYADWDARWDLAGNLPADCDGCGQSFDKAFPYYLNKYPGSKLALVTFNSDATISSYFGISQPTFKTALLAFSAKEIDGKANARYFFLEGNAHGLLDNLARPAGGTTLGKWLGDMGTGAAGWKNIKP